jgi:hypothetical protein
VKTRNELLAMAEAALETTSIASDQPEALLLHGILAVMLAKERREGEQAPTHEQMGRLVEAAEGIPHALWHKDR